MEEQKNTYENVTLEPDVGFDIRFVTMDHNSPFHWHTQTGAGGFCCFYSSPSRSRNSSVMHHRPASPTRA